MRNLNIVNCCVLIYFTNINNFPFTAYGKEYKILIAIILINCKAMLFTNIFLTKLHTRKRITNKNCIRYKSGQHRNNVVRYRSRCFFIRWLKVYEL